MKVLLNYDKGSGQLTKDDGTLVIVTYDRIEDCEYVEPESQAATLVSLGLSADDLVKLKYNKII